MSTNWYFVQNRRKVGPVPFAHLQRLAAAGRILPKDMIFQEGTQKWVAAISVAGLFPPPQLPSEVVQTPGRAPVVCPSCNRKLNAPEKTVGKKGRCPKCAQQLTVPGAAERAKATPKGAGLPDWMTPIGTNAEGASAGRSEHQTEKPHPPAAAPPTIPTRLVADAPAPSAPSSPPDQGGIGDDVFDKLENALPEHRRRHFAEVRYYAFLVGVLISLPSISLPTLFTLLTGSPKAGYEQFLSVWNVVYLTLPLTLAAAIDAGVLFSIWKHPEHRPTTTKDWSALAGVLSGVIVASVLVGSALGAVEIPGSVTGTAKSVANNRPELVVHVLCSLAEEYPRAAAVVVVVALCVGAAAGLENYFTLYGPQPFFSSLVVGAFLGWVWAVKVPAIASARPAPEAEIVRQRITQRVAALVVAGVVVLAMLYRWGGLSAVGYGVAALVAAGLCAGPDWYTEKKVTRCEPGRREILWASVAGLIGVHQRRSRIGLRPIRGQRAKQRGRRRGVLFGRVRPLLETPSLPNHRRTAVIRPPAERSRHDPMSALVCSPPLVMPPSCRSKVLHRPSSRRAREWSSCAW